MRAGRLARSISPIGASGLFDKYLSDESGIHSESMLKPRRRFLPQVCSSVVFLRSSVLAFKRIG
jgi:hypothetical protein